MSKPITRVVFAVLISLAILAAVATTVQARLGNLLRKADGNNASFTIFANHQALGRGNMSSRGYTYFQYDDYAPDYNHDCHSDPSLDD